MPLELTPFPAVPPSRTALTTADTARYITGPAAANFARIETLLESVEAAIAALPTHSRSASMPDTAGLYDLWIDTSEGDQPKYSINPYTSGNGVTGDWVSLRDAATQTLATSAAASAATATLQQASAFPSFYTINWIFVNSTTGATYVCNETYTAATAEVDREGKFTAIRDAITSAAAVSAQAAIDNLADDGIITANEKITSQREWEQIQENKNLGTTLATSLGQTGAATYITMVAAYDALNTYLNITLNIFDDLTSDVSLVSLVTNRSTWKSKWKAYYSAMSAFQDFITTTQNDDLDSVQSDETITEAEKREAYTRWVYEVKNYANISSTLDAIDASLAITYTKASDPNWIAYNSAYNSLNTYLNTTLDLFNNPSWPLILSTKSSNAAEWVSKWQAYTDAESDISTSVTDISISSIDGLGDDNIIGAGGEKNLARSAWNTINGTAGTGGEYDLLSQRTTSLIAAGQTSLSTLKTNLDADYAALKGYLDGLTDFYNASVDTPVDNSEWDFIWTNYYKTYATLDATVSQVYDTQIGLVSNIVDDGTISSGMEKEELRELMGRLAIEKNKMVARAAIGVGASSTAYVAAYDALYTYITGSVYASVAAFNDAPTVATGIDRGTFRSAFDAYYTAREDLQTTIISNNFNNLSLDSAAIPNMTTDGSITSEEKYVAQTYWTAIYGSSDDGEKAALLTQANDFGVSSTYFDALSDAFQCLFNFLYNNDKGAPLSAAVPIEVFTDMGATTTLDASQQSYWQTYWSAYYTARDTMILQIQGALNTEVDGKIDKDGSVVMESNLQMGNNLITGLAQGGAAGQAVEYGQLFTIHEPATTDVHGVGDGAIVGTTLNQTLTNKTLSTPVVSSIYQDAGKTKLLTLPPFTDTLAIVSTAQTLTNKTLGTGTVLNVDNAIVTNIETDNFKDYGAGDTAIRTDIRASAAGASNTRLVSELGIATALEAVRASAIAASVSAAGTPFGCYVSESQSGAPKTIWVSTALGTGIDLVSNGGADYTASSFNLQFKSLSQDIGEDGTNISFPYRKLYLNGIIKKLSGSDPVVILEWFEIGQGELNQTDTGGSMLGTAIAYPFTLSDAREGDAYLTNLEFEMLNISNELCIRLRLTTASIGFCDFRMWITGPLVFGGTPISPGQGTLSLIHI